MKRGLSWMGLGVFLGVAACVFQPDLSRFPRCETQGACPIGSTCLASEGICLPDCGMHGPCTGEEPVGRNDGGTADSGTDVDPTRLVLVPEEPGAGVESVNYFHQFQVRGGTPPYTFSLAPNELPPGLTFDVTGALSGRPTLAGDFPLTVEVVDRGATQQRSTRTFSLRIRPPLRLTGPFILADIEVGAPYLEQISARGGKTPYKFEPVPGETLPSGIVLGANGQVSGTTNEEAVTRAFSVKVTDADEPPQVVIRTFQATTRTCPSLSVCIRTRELPEARVGTAYSYTLQSTPTSVTWSLDKSKLPPGIVFDEKTGVFSGTPTHAQTAPYKLTVSASGGVFNGSAQKDLMLEVR